MIAASFDDIVAITGYSIFSSIAITGQSDVAWQIASGPLQVRGWGCRSGRPSAASAGTPCLVPCAPQMAVPALVTTRSSHCAAWSEQVVFGIVGGIIGGVLLGCTRLFSSRLKRLVGLYGGALILMFFLEYWNLLSGEPARWQTESIISIAGERLHRVAGPRHAAS